MHIEDQSTKEKANLFNTMWEIFKYRTKMI